MMDPNQWYIYITFGELIFALKETPGTEEIVQDLEILRDEFTDACFDKLIGVLSGNNY